MPRKSRSKINYVQCKNCLEFKVKPERAEQYPACYRCWKKEYSTVLEYYMTGKLENDTTVKCLGLFCFG